MMSLIKDIGKRNFDSQNVIHWLETRETTIFSSSEFHHQRHRLYLSILPSYSENGVNTPDLCYLRKFSPDGKFLMAFSQSQLNVEVYQFNGSSAGNQLYQRNNGNVDIQNQLFEAFFVKLYSIPVVVLHPEVLNRECSLFVDSGRYVVVGSSCPVQEDPYPHMYDTFRNNESLSPNPRFSLEDHTIYQVDLYCGQVTDSCSFKCDKIFLSHNQGLSLCGSRLAILSVQHQTIHLFELCAGTFIPILEIGRFCYPDDGFVYSLAGLMNADEDGPPDGTHWPFLEKWMNSLKHRFLCRIMSQSKELCTEGNSTPLLSFFRRFTYLSSLRIWKMQMLDEHTLLLKYTSEDVITLKQTDTLSQPAFFALYDIDSTEVVRVFENTSDHFLRLYEQHSNLFWSPVSQPSSAIVCSVSNCPFTRAVHMKFKKTITLAKYGGATEATKRLLVQLPVCAQSFSLSPYLDLELFRYDEKWISPLEKPKPLGDSPIK